MERKGFTTIELSESQVSVLQRAVSDSRALAVLMAESRLVTREQIDGLAEHRAVLAELDNLLVDAWLDTRGALKASELKPIRRPRFPQDKGGEQ